MTSEGHGRDPVCGMRVGPGSPSVTHRGRTYRFCSEVCRRQFEIEPDVYVDRFDEDSPRFARVRRDFWIAVGVAILSNLLGVLGLYVYLVLVFGPERVLTHPMLNLLLLALGFLLGLSLGGWLLAPLLRYFIGRDPAGGPEITDTLRVQALNAPVVLSLVNFAMWLVLGSLLALFYVHEGDISTLRWFGHVFMGNLFAGAIVALDVFYLVEMMFSWRVMPHLMEDRTVSSLEGVVPVPVWARITLLVLTTAVAPMVHVLGLHWVGDAHGSVILYFTAAVVVIAVFQALYILRSISLPIGRIADEFRRFQAGQPLRRTFSIYRGDKLGRFTEMFEDLMDSIHERSFLQRTFGRYMSQQVLDEILDGHLDLGGTRHRATVLFADIRDFTALTEGSEPEEVVRLLNEYFDRMVEAITERDGIPDKFIGDGILAVWGVPSSTEDHARRAVEGGRAMLEALASLNRERERLDREPLRIGIGIHTGELIAGNIGSRKKMEFTIIGDTVNTCSRIERKNKELGASLTISEAVYRELDEDVRGTFRAVPAVRLRGKQEPLNLFTLRGDHG